MLLREDDHLKEFREIGEEVIDSRSLDDLPSGFPLRRKESAKEKETRKERKEKKKRTNRPGGVHQVLIHLNQQRVRPLVRGRKRVRKEGLGTRLGVVLSRKPRVTHEVTEGEKGAHLNEIPDSNGSPLAVRHRKEAYRKQAERRERE